MKIRIWLLLALLLTSLAACRSPTPVATQAPAPAVTQNALVASTEYPAPSATQASTATQVPPASTEVQPYPAQGAESETQQQVSTAPPYPAPGEAETIDWPKAEEVILSGDVIQIHQARSLQITLTLKDGRTMITTEPAFDEVVRVKERCAEKCDHILLSSESQQ